MEHLRAHHDVNTVVGKWESQGVAANRERDRSRAGDRQLKCRIAADRAELEPVLFRGLSGATWNVAEPGPHVEQFRAGSQSLQYAQESLDYRADPAEKGVGTRDICQR